MKDLIYSACEWAQSDAFSFPNLTVWLRVELRPAKLFDFDEGLPIVLETPKELAALRLGDLVIFVSM